MLLGVSKAVWLYVGMSFGLSVIYLATAMLILDPLKAYRTSVLVKQLAILLIVCGLALIAFDRPVHSWLIRHHLTGLPIVD